MFSVAVKGYGIVIWEGDGAWRTFSANESMSATLAARVEMALETLDHPRPTEDAACSALLPIAGAHLLSVDCRHGPNDCCSDTLNGRGRGDRATGDDSCRDLAVLPSEPRPPLPIGHAPWGFMSDTPDDLAIHARAVTRVYKAKPDPVTALGGVDLDVEPGEFFGLLGPNGAGKTTLIKILTTLLLPTSGTARVAGFDVVDETAKIRRVINMVSGGEQSGYGLLTTREQLWMFSQFYGLPQ